MRWPSVKQVAAELRALRDELVNGEDLDVRLQVHENGDWEVHYGDPGWDLDHRGYWGAGTIPSRGRFNATAEAKSMLQEAKDQAYAEKAYGEENPSGGATAALALGGIAIGALGAWLAYPAVMAHMTPRTNTLGLPAPGQSASSGSFRLSTSSDGKTLTITDNSTEGAGAQTNLSIAALSGNLNAGSLTMANAPNILANVNNAFQGQGLNIVGAQGLPRGVGAVQMNPQLG